MNSIIQKTNFSVEFAAPSSFAFKAASEGVIEGYASTFGEVDLHRDIVARGAFAKSLADHRQRGTLPAMLWAHSPSAPVGKWTEIAEDAKGLWSVGKINLETSAGRQAWEHVKAGDVGGLSIGCQIPEGCREYNRGDGTSLLKEILLHEVSLVAIPANQSARITSLKSITSKGELVDLLREIGLPKTAAARVAAGGWLALAGADHQKAIDFAAQIDAATQKFRDL